MVMQNLGGKQGALSLVYVTMVTLLRCRARQLCQADHVNAKLKKMVMQR